MPRRLLLPAFVAGAVLLGGCVPTAEASAAPTGPHAGSTALAGFVTDSEAAVSTARLRTVDTVELDAEQLTFSEGDTVVAVVPMTDGDGTVEVLRRLLGKPRTTRTADGDGGACLPASTSYTWGRGLRVVELDDAAARGNDVDVRILKPSIPSRIGTTVQLRGPDGVAVGDDIASRIAATSDADKESYASGEAPNWQIVLQQGWAVDQATSDHEVDGVSAITKGTRVAVIGSPMPVHSSDDC